MDTITELMQKTADLPRCVADMRKAGTELADAEQAYRIEKALRILAYREAGYPATYIIDLAKGERRVSELMHDRDVASIMWESSREALNVCKLQVRVLEAQAEREWSNAHRL